MPKKASALVAAFATSSMLLFTAGSAVAAPPAPDLDSVAIGGTGPSATFTNGSFDIDRFAVQNGELVAVGTLTGTLTNTATGAVDSISQSVSLPLQVSGTCEILDLTLGPLDLNLLGLMVHLDQVHLVITAQQGPGNLLGNLLCGIAGLLDANAPLNAIARLLNQLLGLLG